MTVLRVSKTAKLIAGIPICHIAYIFLTSRRHSADVFILAAEAVCLLLSLGLIESQIGPRGFSRNLVQIFLFFYAAIFFLGVPVAYDNMNDSDPSAARDFVIASLFVIPLVSVSTTFCSFIIKEAKDFSLPPAGRMSAKITMWSAGVLGILILGWYLWQTRDAVPLVNAVGGVGPEETARLRHDSLAGLRPASLASFFQYTRDFLLPIGALLSILRWLENKTSKSTLIAFFFCSLASITGILTLEKSPLVNLVVALVAGLSIASQRPPRLLISISVAITALGVLTLTKLTNASDRTLGNLAEGLYRRLVLGPSEVAVQYFSWAPKQSGGFLEGAGLPLLHHFASRGAIDVPKEIYKYMRPEETVVGSANGAFHAMAWVEFGWYAVVVSSLLIGVILVVVGVISSRMANGALRITVLSLTVVTILKTLSTSLTSSLMGVGLSFLDTVIVLFVIDHLATRRHTSNVTKKLSNNRHES